MVTVELDDDVVGPIGPAVVEIGEIALFASCPARPVLSLVGRLRVGGGDTHAALGEPGRGACGAGGKVWGAAGSLKENGGCLAWGDPADADVVAFIQTHG